MLSVHFLIILHYRDEHPRVRYAACNALGQMSTDFQPNLQKAYHETVSTYSRIYITAFSYMMTWVYRVRGVWMVTTKSSAPKPASWPGQVIGWWDMLVLLWPICLYNQEVQFEASNIGLNKHSVTEHGAWWQWNISPPNYFSSEPMHYRSAWMCRVNFPQASLVQVQINIFSHNNPCTIMVWHVLTGISFI